jgi:hypothetical protein
LRQKNSAYKLKFKNLDDGLNNEEDWINYINTLLLGQSASNMKAAQESCDVWAYLELSMER